jgi:hypothetical protein
MAPPLTGHASADAAARSACSMRRVASNAESRAVSTARGAAARMSKRSPERAGSPLSRNTAHPIGRIASNHA